jgi:fluoride exporter
MNVFCIAVGGFFGAISRYYLSGFLNRKYGVMPIGTLIVNIFGSFLLGLLIGIDLNQYVYHLLGVGFLGAFTTFSTFMVEVIGLYESKSSKSMIVYLVTSIVLGLVFAFVGLRLGSLV